MDKPIFTSINKVDDYLKNSLYPVSYQTIAKRNNMKFKYTRYILNTYFNHAKIKTFKLSNPKHNLYKLYLVE
jgi:hypothetical protein